MPAPKYQVLLDRLLDEIRSGRLREGDQVPSERALARRHGVSRVTARRVLAELTALGAAVRRGPHGTIVTAGARARGGDPLTLVCSSVPMLLVDAFLEQGLAFARRRGLEANVVRVQAGNDAAARQAVALPRPAIVMASDLDLDPAGSLARALGRARDRVAVLGTRLDGLGVPSVVCDDARGMALALDHLRERGHRRIALVCGHEPLDHPVLAVMVRAWRERAREALSGAALEAALVRLPTRPFESPVMACYGMMREYLRSPGSRAITALLCLKEELAIGAEAAGRECGRPVPERLSIVEYAGTRRSAIAAVPRTSVDVHIDRHLEAAWEMIGMARQGRLGEARARFVAPTLVARKSVRTLRAGRA